MIGVIVNMKIPKKEYSRDYELERDPNPNLRLFPCDFRELEEECEQDGWS